jgi:hypothetical protein
MHREVDGQWNDLTISSIEDPLKPLVLAPMKDQGKCQMQLRVNIL